MVAKTAINYYLRISSILVLTAEAEVKVLFVEIRFSPRALSSLKFSNKGICKLRSFPLESCFAKSCASCINLGSGLFTHIVTFLLILLLLGLDIDWC